MTIFILLYTFCLWVSINYVACYDNHSSFTHPASSSESQFFHLDLNCIVLSDDPSHVFPVKIARTESISTLKKMIKEEKKPAFDHVPTDTLSLWKVSACWLR